MQCVAAALSEVVELRDAEGRRIEVELRRAVNRIEAGAETIEALAPERLVRERDRLRQRVTLLAGDVRADEERLAREIAYLAEKWDIAEELARLRSHVALFVETLDAAGGDGPAKAGKRLGFVVQEMHREANTVGAKANDGAISAAAVGIKEELERDPGTAGECGVRTEPGELDAPGPQRGGGRVRGPLILVGPSGAGKTSIAARLVERHAGRFALSVSATTRAPRTGEEDGRDYHFVSQDAFGRMLRSGELAEWAQVHGERYGTPVANLAPPRGGRARHRAGH